MLRLRCRLGGDEGSLGEVIRVEGARLCTLGGGWPAVGVHGAKQAV